MKHHRLKKIGIILVPLFFSAFVTRAQVASWSFNNMLAGTGSANSTAGNASLGSAITTGAFSGGTVYYGEGPWPAGGIDLNAYLEFSITPKPGNTLTISSLVMKIRRSTTGSSGAGPNTWSLRSSLDAYATDIASGVLTLNSTPAKTVTLGVVFINLPAKITFRLYGYHSTSSSGGLNRFVYDDIVANGATVLPLVFDYFNVNAVNQSAHISWKLGGEGNLSSVNIERAADGVHFELIKKFNGNQVNTETYFEYFDPLNSPSGTYAYRIQIISEDGNISYSAIRMISFDPVSGFRVQAVNTGNNSSVYFRVNTGAPGDYVFSLYNLNGNKIVVKSVRLGVGSQVMQMDNPPLKSGIYILVGENGNQKTSTKIMVL